MSDDAMARPDGPGASRSATGAEQVVSAHSGDAPSREDNPIVGHKTWEDGTHTPLYKDEADALWTMAEAERSKRQADMPTEQDAIRAMFAAHQRLKELGWSEAIYCPKDGTTFDAIEAGSTGIHTCYYEGEWPNGHWWIVEDGDACPSRPILYRRTEAEKARWAALGRRFRDSDTRRMAETGTGSVRSTGSAGRNGIAPAVPTSPARRIPNNREDE